MWEKLGTLLLLLTVLVSVSKVVVSSVSYDHTSIIINGQRGILISGSIHYPRSTPEMWPDLIQKAKDGGLDVIQTYVLWNGHEPTPGKYNFEGRYDLVRFIKLVQQAVLYVHLRIGPYVCAEWNFGGFPIWLKYIPGISFRTDNEPFKIAMQGFTQKIVEMMKAEKLFEPQGGPIILSQIENEYGPEEWEMGGPGKAYTVWAANMAVSLGTGVPWVMCKQDDTPDPLINTCNGYYCDDFTPNSPSKPKMWTENWTGWYTEFGGAVPYRPVEAVAFSVARFIQQRGSFMNYYMYHGGTNFSRTAGGPFIATSYDYDAPIDEYGLIRQPKWGHLKDLHRAIKLCEPALVSGDPIVTSLGSYQESHVFTSKTGVCAAFLANYDTKAIATVTFRNVHYNLPPWSISILPDCANVVFNTAMVGVQTSNMQMVPVDQGLKWESFDEDIASYGDDPSTVVGLLEQLNVTRDVSDYLWYMTDVDIDSSESFLSNGQYPVLTVMSAGHALHAFVNGKLSGSVYGSLEDPKLTLITSAKLWSGSNRIALLSIAVGLSNVGRQYETWNAGVLGPVELSGLKEGRRDLTWQKWSYKIGLKGESLSLHTLDGSGLVEWYQGSTVIQGQPLTWFDAPSGSDPLALDMSSMSKGQIWINGQSIGRYWPAYTAKGNCGGCDYAGTFDENKCRSNCGGPSQQWYHVPRSWLNPSRNLLVTFEEWGGNPSGIKLVKRIVGSACADVSEWHPTIKNWQIKIYGKPELPQKPKVHLQCGDGQKISSIKFASFGTPQGTCGCFWQGACHSRYSYDIFQKRCIGQQWCSVVISQDDFHGDPCPGVMKRVAVEAVCSKSRDGSDRFFAHILIWQIGKSNSILE